MKGIVLKQNSLGLSFPELNEIKKPTPENGEVLVQIYATCLGPSCLNTYGKEYNKLSARFKKNDIVHSGLEFSGCVVSDSKLFKKGDEVVGAIDYLKGCRTHAEYTVIPEEYLGLKPYFLSHNEAASLLVGCLTSIEALIKLGNIKHGQSVLINGGNGSLGVSAIQLAKYKGCIVTTTASLDHQPDLMALGADKVLDYNTDFLSNHKFDLIFDAAGQLKFHDCKRSLNKHGVFITSQPLNDILGFIQALFSYKKWKFLYVGHSGKNRMKLWAELIENKAIKPVIDSIFPLAHFSEALSHYKNHSVKGKIIIQVKP